METVVKRAQQAAKHEYESNLYSPTARERIAYIKGATFAATVTAEQLEAAARAHYLRAGFTTEDDWNIPGRESERVKDGHRRYARAMFRAAGFRVRADDE